MAYIFHEDDLPRMVGASGGRERIFFVNKELADTDNMLAGVMHYAVGGKSPYHVHENCEHFYFIINGHGSVDTDEGTTKVEPGTMVFIPALENHRLKASEGEPLFYFEFQAPNRFKTTILDGTPDDLKWNRVDGRVWIQT